MVTVDVLGSNILAALLVLLWTFLGGFVLCGSLRVRLGLPAILLSGMAYWAAALYLLPFSHGLDLAAGLALVGTSLLWFRRGAAFTFGLRKVDLPAASILLIGCGAFATLLFTNYVPPGMDASMHATAARLIGANHGLPATYAPFAADLAFPAINIGLPAIAAMAVSCGCSPSSALLGAEVLTFAAFVFACYLLVRSWIRPIPAAFLAVFAVWISRNAQETIEWGGVPTVASVALGLFAARLALEMIRRPAYQHSLPLGLVVAALPLIHAIGAASWLYVVAPVLAVHALLRPRRLLATVGPLSASVAVAVLILVVYLAVGRIPVDEQGLAWARDWQAQFAPKGAGWQMLTAAPLYIKTYAGSAGIWPGVIALGILLWRKSFKAAGLVAMGGLLLCVVVANARSWFLPASVLLYPERAVYWATPLAAVAMALAWRRMPLAWRSSAALQVTLAIGIIVMAGARHYHGYQRLVFRPAVTKADWEALQWSANHLRGEEALVESTYNTSGSYLPAVAGVATTGWHMPLFTNMQALDKLRQRTPTHHFEVCRKTKPQSSAEEVVFENARVRILARKRDAEQHTRR